MSLPPTGPDLLERVVDRLADRATGSVTRTTVGTRLVAVEVDGPEGARTGVAHRPPGDVPTLPSGGADLARWGVEPPTGSPVERALGIAAMNALSAPAIDWHPGDPMAALAADVDRIATVGLFQPAFRKFDAVEVRVVERDPIDGIETPAGVSLATFTPADVEAAFDGVDVVFITGSSLVYGGTADYLRAAADVPTVVLIGATASFLPGPAFDAGATMVAGARVTDPAAVRAGIEAGLCGTDLHDRGLEKVFVAAEAGPAGLDLAAGPRRDTG